MTVSAFERQEVELKILRNRIEGYQVTVARPIRHRVIAKVCLDLR